MIVLLLFIVIILLIEMRIQIRRLPSRNITSTASVVMDSSALIDARIVDIIKLGFISQEIVVPRAVIDELQKLADGRDDYKRMRARRGLDALADIKNFQTTRVVIYDSSHKNVTDTDSVLVDISKRRHWTLCTTDYALQKIAIAEGVATLNVNELAHVIKPRLLPGDVVELKILQKGDTNSQGIGYLDDGTMVVVEGAARKKGAIVKVSVEKFIQTKAGKMLFARIV